MLAEVAKKKGLSLCGIQRDQTTADFSDMRLQPVDAILLASDLSQAIVTASLTSLNLAKNELCGVNRHGTYTSEGIKAIADALKGNASVTVTDMRFNNLDADSAMMLARIAKEKGISLCGIAPGQTEANLQGEAFKRMGPADAILLTADLAVRGSLTSVR